MQSKIAICITGVSRGIGLAPAKEYLNRGERVIGTIRTPTEAIRELRNEHSNQFNTVEMEVTDHESVRGGAAEIGRIVDSIDILINNAGMSPGEPGARIEDIVEEDMQKAWDVNVLGPVRCLKALHPLLQRSDGAKVVMISSTAGSMGRTGGGRGMPYCVSKAALNMTTLLLHFRLAEESIPIVAMHPGWVRTDMGGSEAALSPEESARSMVETIEAITPDGPVYIDYRGEQIPW